MTDPKLYQILHDNIVNYEPRKVRMALQVRATHVMAPLYICIYIYMCVCIYTHCEL